MFSRLPARIIAALVLVVIALLLALLAWSAWKEARTNAARARLSASQTDAVSNSARDAIDAVGGVSGRSEAYDELTRRNADAIRNAKGADAPVDPAAADAGLRSLCLRRAYRGDPKCLRFLAPGGVANAGSARPASGR